MRSANRRLLPKAAGAGRCQICPIADLKSKLAPAERTRLILLTFLVAAQYLVTAIRAVSSSSGTTDSGSVRITLKHHIWLVIAYKRPR